MMRRLIFENQLTESVFKVIFTLTKVNENSILSLFSDEQRAEIEVAPQRTTYSVKTKVDLYFQSDTPRKVSITFNNQKKENDYIQRYYKIYVGKDLQSEFKHIWNYDNLAPEDKEHLGDLGCLRGFLIDDNKIELEFEPSELGRKYYNGELTENVAEDSNDVQDLEIDVAGLEITLPCETKKDILNVYMKEEDFREMTEVLAEKKNIILQGPPGVGKTFVARKIAANLKGKGEGSDKDGNVYSKFIQFHQNYSYEDFVMGYRPKSDGSFEMSYGIFYRFCKAAEKYPQHKFVFIIDEINRGNVSNIFGELLMLIEADKREEYSATLAYKDNDGHEEMFTVPKNVYIIGMMNTADRSLALIDYALRRRFSFFEIEPAFENPNFKEAISKTAETLVDKIKAINIEIEKSLGKGFKIGHSYFCKKDLGEEQLKRIVKYDIIPLLEEYWFDEPEKIDKYRTTLKDCIDNAK